MGLISLCLLIGVLVYFSDAVEAKNDEAKKEDDDEVSTDFRI